MKYIRILFLSLFLLPFGAHAAGGQNEFMIAAQLLAAARNADIQQVQILVNNGANINYVDATGLSLVCTALMNNDTRAAQILQMYGADASQCDRQIKKYNNRTKPKPTGGLFSGLSSVQSMTLAAAGAAVVVGGLLLLTDVLDPGNDNENSNLSGGNRPGSGGNSGGETGGATAAFQLPIGPAPCSVDGTCSDIFPTWEATSDFAYMSGFNYLMMSHAYDAQARGYTGQTVIRLNGAEPFNLNSLPFVETPGGGKPITVAAITANGANDSGSLSDKFITWADSTQIDRVRSVCSSSGSQSTACTEALASMTKTARKFYNRTNMSNLEDVTELTGFDYTGHGTVFGAASNVENLNLKVIAGSESELSATTGDAYGFMPNGQLAIYRTGNGLAVDTNVGTVTNADDATAWSSDDTFTLNGVTYTVTLGENGSFTATDGALGLISGTVDGNVLNFVVDDTNYEAQFAGNVNSLKTIDVMSFNAMLNASKLELNDQPLVGVIANLAQNPLSVNANYMTARGFHGLAMQQPTENAQITRYREKINEYYNLNTDDDADVNTPDVDALALYLRVGNFQDQIIVNSAGAYKFADANGETLGATFENYAPVLFPDLEHLFVTVVAVSNNKGTSGAIEEYETSGGKLVLSQWNREYDDNNVLVDALVSRKCGMNINGGLDPWCFAAPGANAEMAVASMAGAIGLVQSAFNQLKVGTGNISNAQLFTLLALTADGPYLGTKPGTAGGWKDEADLISYLKGIYELPYDYAGVSDTEYLTAFKEVFGYGMINLERATKPGTKIYYYNGTDIVAADGDQANAYWRAAINTNLRASSVLNLAGARVSTAVYDVLESVDGDMRLPRVWESEFALGNTTKRGLYMGDVLGEFSTRKVMPTVTQFGDMTLSMAVSERAYVDNMGGLDNLSLAYSNDNWNMNASYQHYFTDGESRFNGMANPILNLVSNVVTTGADYKYGNWSFGGRGYSGLITDESLLENDPTISAQYMPGKLGRVAGAESHIAYGMDKFGFTVSVGAARESDTLLGAVTDGLLDLGAGDTTYVDIVSSYNLSDKIGFSARATFARTTSDASGAMVLGLTDIDSNSFAFGANMGDFEFTVAQPLAITGGALKYAYADYDVMEVEKGKYDLVVRDAHIADLSLHPDKRELRFTATYRHSFGEFTDGALGLIYRVNPNHTDDFGNESIFMMKMSHRLGI